MEENDITTMGDVVPCPNCEEGEMERNEFKDDLYECSRCDYSERRPGGY